MNAELRKNMGLEIGRAIHMHGPHPDDLYEEIMKVATAFCDQASTISIPHVRCGPLPVICPTGEWGEVEFTMTDEERDEIAKLVLECAHDTGKSFPVIGPDDETVEIIPETDGEEHFCECPGIIPTSDITHLSCVRCGNLLPPDKLN